MTLDGLDADVGTVGLELVELAGCSLGVDLAVYEGVLIVGLIVLRIGINGLVVLGCCCTTIVGECLDVAQEDVGGCTLVLAGYQSVVSKNLRIGSVLGIEESASYLHQGIGVLLVLLVCGLGEVGNVRCLALDTVESCLQLCFLCDCGGAET